MDIQVDRITKCFDSLTVFRDFSCTLPEKRITCITGPSGCGKTTLFRMLMGLEKPDSGCIIGLEGLRLAAVFQEDRLCDSLSAGANARLALPKSTSHQSVSDLFQELGLGEILRTPARDLSGGMRRRVALARALLSDFQLLLMDEPFTGLDRDTRLAVIDCLKSRLHGRTALIITHDPLEPQLLGADIIALTPASNA